jgi:hypothetical protein
LARNYASNVALTFVIIWLPIHSLLNKMCSKINSTSVYSSHLSKEHGTPQIHRRKDNEYDLNQTAAITTLHIGMAMAA